MFGEAGRQAGGDENVPGTGEHPCRAPLGPEEEAFLSRSDQLHELLACGVHGLGRVQCGPSFK